MMTMARSSCPRRLLLPLMKRSSTTNTRWAQNPYPVSTVVSSSTISTTATTTTTAPPWRRQQRQRLSDVLAAMETNNCEDHKRGGHMAYSLSFASLDEYNPFPPLLRPLMAREHEQLRISHDQLRLGTIANLTTATATSKAQATSTATATATAYNNSDDELPRTLEDALRPSKRAIVVTEPRMPFNVVDVNKAWEDLCGYKYTECHGRSLGSLIKGPRTDPLTVTALINQLLRGEDATAIITNYTKDGRPFQNRLRVGPLYTTSHSSQNSLIGPASNQEVSHFVGILEEVA